MGDYVRLMELCTALTKVVDISNLDAILQISERSRRGNDVSYIDYDEDDYEDNSVRRFYRRVPGGFHGRMPRRNRPQSRNRNKRAVNSELNYDYESDADNINVSPEGEYGVLDVPGKKYSYNNKNKNRRYLHRNGYPNSPFFSNSDNEQDQVVIDSTVLSNQHDILGLKKYRERNRKKLAEDNYGFGKVYRKRSVYPPNNLFQMNSGILARTIYPQSNPFQMNSDILAKMQGSSLQHNSLFSNSTFPQNFNGNINFINRAAVDTDFQNYDQGNNNSGLANQFNSPINSHFEGLMYPNIDEVINKLKAKQHNQKVLDVDSPTTSTESLVIAKSINQMFENLTTVHINSLYDVTHPTSALEQRILATSDDTLEERQKESISTSTISNVKRTLLSKSNEFSENENENQRMLERNIQKNTYRVKGSNLNNIEDKRKNQKLAILTDNSNNFDYNENYEDYNYDELNNLKLHDEEIDADDTNDYLKKDQETNNEESPFLVNEKSPYKIRRLLSSQVEDCREGNKSLCSIRIKRALSDMLGMDNEEDYKDDLNSKKELLKKASGEGEDEDDSGDPYIGKKLKFMTKKKENEPVHSKNKVGVSKKFSNSQAVKGRVQLTETANEEVERKLRSDKSNDDFCGTGKNKIYCNMKDEIDDDTTSNNNQSESEDFNQNNDGKRNNQTPDATNGEKDHNNQNFLFNPSNESIMEERNLNKQVPVQKQIKIIQISEVVNSPQIESKDYKSKQVAVGGDTIIDSTSMKSLPSTAEPKRNMVISRNAFGNNSPLELREESNQDIIEAGFKRKMEAQNEDRQKRKHKAHTYLDRLRLNNHRNNNIQKYRHHKLPTFLINDYHQTVPQQSKNTINFPEPSEDGKAYIRRERSFQQPQYSPEKENKGESISTFNVSSVTEKTVESISTAVEVSTEIYPDNSKPPVQFIGFPKEKPYHATSTLNTEIAAAIVNEIFEAINSNPSLGSSLGKGLCKQSERQKSIQDLTDIDKNSTTTDLKDTRNLLESLMTAINKIIEEKVKARLCRALPPPLKAYLKTIVKLPKPHGAGGDSSAENLLLPQVKKTREATEEHPDAEQADFLFYKDNYETPEIKRRFIKYKIKILESLLDDYGRMSGKCKVKMRFIRDYLEKNLAILHTLHEKCSDEEVDKMNAPQQQLQKVKKKHTSHPKGRKTNKGNEFGRSIDEQLQKIGWDTRNDKLLPESDVEKIVRQSMGKEKRDLQSNINNEHLGSSEYNTLVKEVEKVRKKQEKEEKLAKLFGGKRSVKNENYETIKSRNKETQDFENLNFEEPVVYSMDN